MTCSEVQERFGDFFDLPEEDPAHEEVLRHLEQCPECAAEFEMWKESMELIRNCRVEHFEPVRVTPVAGRVMDRIYKDESWRIPVADRIYSIPYKLRRNLTAIIAFCLALFLVSFLYSVTSDNTKETTAHGFIPAASASGSLSDAAVNVASMPRTTLASATLIKPMKIGMIKTAPDYFLALSLLGMISALLTMNWLSRTRS